MMELILEITTKIVVGVMLTYMAGDYLGRLLGNLVEYYDYSTFERTYYDGG